MAAEINTSITIGAPRDVVWSVLLDLPRYPEWNPFILSIEGEPKLGGRLTAVIKPPGRAAQTFTPAVVALEPTVQFHWRGSLPIPGLFAGTHMFDLSDTAGGTHLSHRESFSGLLIPLLGGVLQASETGFLEMNRALKRRCEA